MACEPAVVILLSMCVYYEAGAVSPAYLRLQMSQLAPCSSCIYGPKYPGNDYDH